MRQILVTGGTGFLAAHIIVQLLDAGYSVRTTVRSPSRRDAVMAMVRAGGANPEGLDVFTADLEQDQGWAEAVAGCDYVLHVASPFPATEPANEDELIRPAHEGTLRVLRAARDAGVKRVVMTSSFAAIGYGHAPRTTALTEVDWSTPEAPDVTPYIRSKILAERAAWDFVAQDGGELELSVINPTGIFGPVLGPDYASSIRIVDAMLKGTMPFAPHISFGVVDVRDAADLHIRAMTAPTAAGERFIAVSGEPVALIDVSRMLRTRLGSAAGKAPRIALPNWLVRLMARLVPGLRGSLGQLGVVRRASSRKAREHLGWQPRSNEETLVDTARSLLALAGKD